MSEQKSYELGHHPDMAPPANTIGLVGWMRSNLFSSPLNGFLTAVCIYIVYLLVPTALLWTVIDADWFGSTRDDCSREGGLLDLYRFLVQTNHVRALSGYRTLAYQFVLFSVGRRDRFAALSRL